MTKIQRLDGKVAVVTGGGRNIGRSEALLFASEGARVVVNDLGGGPRGGGTDPSIAKRVVEEIRAQGGEAIAETSSISGFEGAKTLIDKTIEVFGRIDILINNAGIARAKRIDQIDEEDWDLVHDVNLKGCCATMKFAAPHLIAQGSGVIINTSSPSGYGHYGMGPYTAAKEGVVGLSRTVARDLGEFGVRCNVIRPFQWKSQMDIPEIADTVSYSQDHLRIPALWNIWTDRVWPVTPASEHVAALVVWLCTDSAREVTGREFFVAGAEIGIMPEPILERVIFHPEGWSIDRLDERPARDYLIGELKNRYTGGMRAESAKGGARG